MSILASVRTVHARYKKYAARWKRCRDCLAGQDEIYAAGVLYLPMLKEQSGEAYEAMKTRTPWFNASWTTVALLLGLMFRKPPTFEAPAGLKVYTDDIDMQGLPFESFAEQFSLEWLSVGNAGILVDYPTVVAPASGFTVAQVEEMGLRPTMQIYQAESIINWKFRRIKNKTVLALVVLQENVSEPVDEFSDKDVIQYRVLDLDPEAGDKYRIRIFRDKAGINSLESESYPQMNSGPIDEIPFYFDPDFEAPPLIDLIDLNLKHYRVSADYEHGCHFTGLPTPYVTGYAAPAVKAGGTPDKFYIGSEIAWIFPDTGTQVGYLEFSGTGLSELRENLLRKEYQMAALGARQLVTEKAGVEAYKTQASRSMGQTSQLASQAVEISRKLLQALTFFAKWCNVTGEIKFDINRDYMPVNVDAPTLTAWFSMWQGGALSEPELFDLLKRGDVIEPEKTLEQHQGEIDAMEPPAPALAVPPALPAQE